MVTIAVCSYRRPVLLAMLLRSIGALRVPHGLVVDVLVVDNDPQCSGRTPTAAAEAGGFPFAIRWIAESCSGVGYSRNRCLQEARGDWLAFVDDDERVDPNWLEALWAVAQGGLVDGVFGPVLADFAAAPSSHVLASGAHQRPRFATGTVMRWGDCRSGNVMFRRSLAAQHGGFDPQFATSGGEDCEFFWRCQDAGARLVWCDEAVVHEHVPAERMERGWLLRRAFNGGRNFARLRATRGGWRSLIVDGAWGCANLLVYALPAVLARLARHRSALRLERKLAGGLGMLLALSRRGGNAYGAAAPGAHGEGRQP